MKLFKKLNKNILIDKEKKLSNYTKKGENMRFFIFVFISIFSINFSTIANNNVLIFKSGKQTCIKSDGTPNHVIGKFPSRGNPHSFKKQNLEFCFPSEPIKNEKFNSKAKTIGITITGIPIRPGTADWYDASSPRKHSRNNLSGWNLEAITPQKKVFGLDENNAHVDRRGLYHYHGMPSKLININGKTLMGYAADGHEIHYLGKAAKPSWVIKNGYRLTEPYGIFDGRFIQDYEFKIGSGNLDQCNGGEINDKFVYFATDTFPFFPRCHWGEVGRDFLKP